MHPALAVPALVDAEGDDLPLTLACGTLIHQQSVPSQPEAALNAAAQIPLRKPPVAVEHQLNGRSRLALIVLSVKLQPVKRGDAKFLIGDLPCFFHPLLHNSPVGLVYLPGRDGILLPGTGVRLGLKGHTEAYVTNEQQQQDQHCQNSEKPNHGKASFSLSLYIRFSKKQFSAEKTCQSPLSPLNWSGETQRGKSAWK